MSPVKTRDVVVLGGGLAGLSVALQIKQMRPKTSVVVVEKRTHPVPEAAFKVGESVAEIGAHYLKDIIGFDEHLAQHQLRKFSLRFFSSHDGNADIARRPEFGLTRFTPAAVYQIDRGRLENALAEAAVDAGVELLGGHTVTGFELGADRHSVAIKRNGDARELDPKWIIDASGRAGVLRRNLRLGVDIDHDVNASYWRLPYRLEVDKWSDDEAWRARVPNGRRWQSTCQLLGEGYWVWLIALPDGRHSVGVVADPRFVPFERIRRYPDVLEWAAEFEPQLAEQLPDSEDGLLDFRKVAHVAYGTRRGLSPQRWCLCGEAGLFLDPLYATGLDFIAVSNTLASRLICGALADEPDLRRRLKAYNAYYLGQFMGWQPAFAGQYEVFRDAPVTAAKVLWDMAGYFSYPVLTFTKGVMLDYEYLGGIKAEFKQHYDLNVYMQRFFREWSRAEYDRRGVGFAYGTDPMVEEVFAAAAKDMPREEVADRVRVGVRRMRRMSHEIIERARELGGFRFDVPPPMELLSSDIDWDEELIGWSPYAQRVAPPANADPQPADAWMLR